MATQMLLYVSFISALAGVGFAGTAALLPDTGIDGTIGAFLALLGAGAATAAIGLLLVTWVPTKVRGVLTGIAGLVAILTALAAWFLMQNALLATMIITLLALILGAVMPSRKISQ